MLTPHAQALLQQINDDTDKLHEKAKSLVCVNADARADYIMAVANDVASALCIAELLLNEALEEYHATV